MAGPGGGPPRRSHTKSRKGCETCKKRHIRCDENFPQCRNCTKHKIRCPYHDIPAPDDRSTTANKPDLMWTPDIHGELRRWRQTGVFPFPKLGICPAPAPQSLTYEELRLVHHVASVSDQLGRMHANTYTIWTREIPLIIKIGATYRYVLDALLAFSADHIAFLTDCALVSNLAYVHRGKALSGLQEAIGSFSKETSDAILAASLVLSWQATDWRGWNQLMHGSLTVIDFMDSWKHESQFGDFIAESCTFPTAPPSPGPNHKSSKLVKEDQDAIDRTMLHLESVEKHIKEKCGDAKSIQQLISFLKGASKVSSSPSVMQRFERLRPLRTWLFWLPVMFLQQTGGSATSLLIIAHYYTVAQLMERVFPEIGAAYFGSLTIGPVEEIARRLKSMEDMEDEEARTANELMGHAIEMVNEFRYRMGWPQPAQSPSFPQDNPSNLHVGQHSPSPVSLGDNSPCSMPYSPYENPAFSYSTEDISVVRADSGTQAATNPLQLSPLSNAQYLKIPSPSYGQWSPASSGFLDCAEFGDTSSITYSPKEEFVPYDISMSPATPLTGSASMYSLGTPELMSTTPTFPPPEGFDFVLPAFANQTFASCHTPSISVTTLPYMESLAPPLHLGHRRNFSTASAPPTLPHGRTDHV